MAFRKSPTMRPVSPIFNQEKWKQPTKDWCVTHIKLNTFSYTWTITNFSVCIKMREFLKSSEFPTGCSSNFTWCLRLNIRDKYYEIGLVLHNSSMGKIRADVKFYFLNANGKKVSCYEPQNSQQFVAHQEDGYSHRFTKDELVKNNLLSGDKLTIYVEVCVIADRMNKTSSTYIAHFEEPECTVIENFGSILDKGNFSDVTFDVNGTEFRAHKAILSARSIVFAAMFDHDMIENEKNIVTITDINQDAFKEMLHFIYTGKAPKIDQMAIKLLSVADKYALEKLKAVCEVALFRNLSEETAAETLVLADLHRSKQLKRQTINFIKTYASSVAKTSGWQNLIKQHSFIHLIAENDLQI